MNTTSFQDIQKQLIQNFLIRNEVATSQAIIDEHTEMELTQKFLLPELRCESQYLIET